MAGERANGRTPTTRPHAHALATCTHSHYVLQEQSKNTEETKGEETKGGETKEEETKVVEEEKEEKGGGGAAVMSGSTGMVSYGAAAGAEHDDLQVGRQASLPGE